MHLVLIVIESKGVSVSEPIFQWESELAKVLLSEHVVPVPDNDLDCTEPIGEGEVDRKVERSIFQTELWVCITLDNRGVVSRIQQGDYDEARDE